MINNSEVLFTLLGAAVILLLLLVAVFLFAFLFQRRQQTHLLEKATLKARFEQESLNAKSEVRENTMRHIARELHDNISQLLFLVKIQLNTLETESGGNRRITDSKEFLNRAISEISGLSKTLNSENILAAGLSEAITFELQRIRKTGFVNAKFDDKTTNWNVNPRAEIIIFRIFQDISGKCAKRNQTRPGEKHRR
jgi:hypothetical protein